MTDGGEIEALVRRLCAARVAGDMDVLRRGYADNATFRIVGSPRMGRAHGATWRAMARSWRGSSP